MANYDWSKFDVAYGEVIGSISRSNPVGASGQADLGVAREMLVYMADHPDGETYAGVPAGFNWGKCRDAIAAVRTQE